MAVVIVGLKVLRDVGKVVEVLTVLADAVDVAYFVLTNQMLLGKH